MGGSLGRSTWVRGLRARVTRRISHLVRRIAADTAPATKSLVGSSRSALDFLLKVRHEEFEGEAGFGGIELARFGFRHKVFQSFRQCQCFDAKRLVGNLKQLSASDVPQLGSDFSCKAIRLKLPDSRANRAETFYDSGIGLRTADLVEKRF